MSEALDPNFFRAAWGRTVAALTRRFGAEQLQTVEDSVQGALERLLERAVSGARPDDPSAWVYRVAHNGVVDSLRTARRRAELAVAVAGDDLGGAPERAPRFAAELDDDLLRMLFACASPALVADDQVVLALRLLCGFSVAEIAARLFATEGSIYRRLSRARARFRAVASGREPGQERASAWLLDRVPERRRVPGVRTMLYLLFTEGHLAIGPEPIREDLCREAIRLAEVLVGHPIGDDPETRALLALMWLSVARIPGRTDLEGGVILLEDQDRTRWDRAAIGRGMAWLHASAEGDVYSRFHAEAGIAAAHALAPTYAATPWSRIADGYAALERLAPSPVHRLNRAVAVAEARGPAAGLEVLGEAPPPAWLERSYLWHAVAADLHRRTGDTERAAAHASCALEAAPSEAIAAVLRRRLSE